MDGAKGKLTGLRDGRPGVGWTKEPELKLSEAGKLFAAGRELAVGASRRG